MDSDPESGPDQSSSSQDAALSSAAEDADNNAGTDGACDPVTSCPLSPPPVPARIMVHVQDPLGNPVSGAVVEVVENGMTGTTDVSGDHDFGDVPEGSYTITATLQSASASQTHFAASATSTAFTLTLQWTLIARWVDTQVYCGDNATLEAAVVPVPPVTPITVEVLHPSTGAVIATFGATITGGSVQFTWTVKSQTATWRTDRIPFRVTLSSLPLTGTSSNQLTFRQRPTTSWVTLDNNRGTPAGFADVTEHVDARLEADQVHYSLKIELEAEHFWQSMPWSAARQATEKANIETIWNNAFSAKKFHRTSCARGRGCNCAFDCCKAGFHLDVNFVTSGEHFEVEIRLASTPDHSGTSRGNSFWSDPPIDATTSYAHEVGHMLGNFDEYAGGAVDPSGVQPAVAATANLMSTAGVTTLLNVHYRWVLAYLNANSGGDSYEIIPP